MTETPVDAASSGDSTQFWLERLCRRADDVLWDGYRFALAVGRRAVAARHVPVERP